MIVAFIDEQRAQGRAVESVCRVLREQGLQVAARTYRAWHRANQPVADRTVTDAIVVDAVRDIAWTSPTALSVLHRVARQLYEVRTVPVDGSPATVEDLLTTLPTTVVSLVGSPVASEPLLAVTRTSLVDPRGELAQAALESGTDSVGYVG